MEFTVWRHTWRKNWVNWAVLTGNSAGLRTVISSSFSYIELRSSLRKSHSFLSLSSDTTMASSQGTQLSKMNKTEATFAFTEVYRSLHELQPPQSHAQEDTENWQKNWQTWCKTCAVPENKQFSISCSFFYTVKLQSLTLRRRIKSHLLFAGIIRSSPFSLR